MISRATISGDLDVDEVRVNQQRSLTDLGHLSSAVGHHVINAFAAIVCNAEILRMKAAAPNSMDLVAVSEMMVKTALEASTVARRLIDFTRPTTTPRWEPIAIDELIGEVFREEESKGRPDTTWSVNFIQPIPQIQGCREQLREMIGLFLTNSYEASQERPLEIGVIGRLDERGWLVIEIRDNASGMPPHVLEKAVEPFFSTKPAHLGVGLSIANGIWRRHRGTLSVLSVPDQGTCIRLMVDPPK